MDIDTLLKNTSRSLYLSVRALPKNIRGAFGIAYLLCRYADTIADTDILPAQRRLYWVNRFPSLLQTQNPDEEQQLIHEISGQSTNPHETELIKNLQPCLNIFNQIPEQQKSFILEVVQNVCEGMKLDLSFFGTGEKLRSFDTDEQLKNYCRLMGGKPGRFWSQLIYHSSKISIPEEDFYQLGEKIGDALQIVNILRDLPKDLQLGRCYFPQSDLRKQNLSPTDLLNPENSARFEPIKRKWTLWGKENLTNGLFYYKLLADAHPRQRAAVAWPLLWTADTFLKLSQTPDLLCADKRVKIPRRIIYKTLFFTPFLLKSNRIFSWWFHKKLNKIS